MNNIGMNIYLIKLNNYYVVARHDWLVTTDEEEIKKRREEIDDFCMYYFGEDVCYQSINLEFKESNVDKSIISFENLIKDFLENYTSEDGSKLVLSDLTEIEGNMLAESFPLKLQYDGEYYHIFKIDQWNNLVVKRLNKYFELPIKDNKNAIERIKISLELE